MSDALVLANAEEGILWLTLNQPARRNPLSSDMIAALSAAIASGNEDAKTRVIVIRPRSPRSAQDMTCGKHGAVMVKIKTTGKRESMLSCRTARP